MASGEAQAIRTQRQFGCWLNAWADLRRHEQASKRPGERLNSSWAAGYRQAVNDIADVHHRLTPDWMDVWYGRGRSFTADEDSAALSRPDTVTPVSGPESDR